LISKSRARLDRVYERIERQWPISAGFLRWVQRPSLILLRIPIGVLLVFGGVLSFLPILGIWMLPLGLMLLAIDFPPLQGPVAWAIIKGQRWWELRKRRKRDERVARTA
jgi:hypothetical protein